MEPRGEKSGRQLRSANVSERCPVLKFRARPTSKFGPPLPANLCRPHRPARAQRGQHTMPIVIKTRIFHIFHISGNHSKAVNLFAKRRKLNSFLEVAWSRGGEGQFPPLPPVRPWSGGLACDAAAHKTRALACSAAQLPPHLTTAATHKSTTSSLLQMEA